MTVFHLKYRPKKISELECGKAAEGLTRILKQKETPQTFLFAGPKGSGKTSAARLLGLAVNCEKKKGVEPCGECQSCEAILRGGCLDVIEIDAASNRGVEEVRELKDRVYLMPTVLAKKVFIIDEAQMMTREAFNALLKLIEEPPKHTIFVLCTTDPGKIPDTVLSRLFRIDFSRGLKEELEASVKRVAKGEKINLGEGVIDLLVEKSDGSFRNLHRTLNELVMRFGEKITLAEARTFIADAWGDYTPREMEIDLSGGEMTKVMDRLEKMAAAGADFGRFRENLLAYFQKRMLANMGVGDEKSEWTVGRIRHWLDLLIEAGKKENKTEIEQLPIELAVAEFLEGKDEREPKKKVEKVKKEARVVEQVKEVEEVKGTEEMIKQWGNVLLAVKPYNHSVEAFLRACRPVEDRKGILVVEVFYPFHKQKLEEEKNREIVEKGLEKVFGRKMKFECVLAKIKTKIAGEEISPVAMVTENTGSTDKDIYEVAREIFG